MRSGCHLTYRAGPRGLPSGPSRVRVFRTRTPGSCAIWLIVAAGMGLGALTEGAKLRRKGILALALALAATLSVGVVVAPAATSYSTKIEFRGNQGSSL